MTDVPNTFAGKEGDVPASELDENFESLGTAIDEKSAEAKDDAVAEVRGTVSADMDTLEKQAVSIGIARADAASALGATFVIGDVETLATGEPATATITGTPTEKVLNLGLPAGGEGDQGPTGQTPNLQVADVTLGGVGQAAVTITGSAEQPRLHFTVPQGAAGVEGPIGPPGATLNERGEWDDETEYAAQDLVEHDGSSFYALIDNTGVEPPSSGSTSTWQVFARRGIDGITPVITSGTITTLDPGDPVEVTITGTTEAPILNIGIPGGTPGANGLGFATVAYGVPAVVIVDANKYILARITETTFEHPELDSWRTRLDASSPALYAGQGDGGLVLVDGDGYIAFQITPRQIRHVEADVWRADLKRAAIPARDSAENSVQAIAQRCQFFNYGQSKALGYDSLIAVSPLPLLYALRFAGGARPIDLSLDPTVAYADLRPYRERAGSVRRDPFNPTGTVGAVNLVETPMGGALQMLAQLLLDEDGIDISDGAGQQFIGSVYGAPGTSVRGLSPNSITGPSPPIEAAQYNYDDLMDGAEYGQSLTVGAGLSWQPLSVYFDEGEQDTQESLARATYKTRVIALQAKHQADVQVLTGGSAPVPWVLSQMASHLHYSKTTPDMALAHYELARDVSVFSLASPQYILPYNVDGVHLPAVGSRLQGLYVGLAWKRRHFDGVKQKMTRPASFVRSGKIIVATFEMPGKRLVLDNTYTGPASVANFGLTMVTSGGSAVTISDVELVGRDRLRIVCATDPGANCKLRHGWLGTAQTAAGGIRDDQGDRVVFDPTGLNIPLHSWAPIFEETVA